MSRLSNQSLYGLGSGIGTVETYPADIMLQRPLVFMVYKNGFRSKWSGLRCALHFNPGTGLVWRSF
ncbi:MAG: hypothetical protein IPM91_06025 [Bacteroidetes bacterium]|nr:hypothetical protein [Bacteroidota bacterium]